MKKSLIAAMMAVVCGLIVCGLSACGNKDRVITFAELPEAAQLIVNENFNAGDIAYITVDHDVLCDEYEVRFNDGAELKFNRDGKLEKADCKLAAVPDALVPEVVREYVGTQFPEAFIVEWGKEGWGWKAELNNKLELRFNSKLEFVGIDD